MTPCTDPRDNLHDDAERDGQEIEKLLAAIHASAAPGEIRPVERTGYEE